MKIVRAGRAARRRRLGPARHPRPRACAGTRPSRRSPGQVQRARHLAGVRRARPLLRRRDGDQAAPVVIDAANGMAGAMLPPVLERLPIEAVAPLLRARRHLPEPRAEPAAAREPRVHRREDDERGRRLRRRVRRRRRPLLLRRRRGRLRPRRLRDGAARRVGAGEGARARRSSTTSAPAGRCPRRSSAPAASPLINRVGHAFIKHRMREEGAVFGGEVSGHYYFRDFSQADSGVVPFLLMLELVSRRGQKLSEILAPYRERYFITGELNTPVPGRGAQARGAGGALRPARARSRTSTGSPSTPTTGTSTSARRTPSRCCGSTSRRAREELMERKRDEVLDVIRASEARARPRPTGSRRSSTRRSRASASPTPTRRGSSTTAATCPTSTSRASSTTGTSASCRRAPTRNASS